MQNIQIGYTVLQNLEMLDITLDGTYLYIHYHWSLRSKKVIFRQSEILYPLVKIVFY